MTASTAQLLRELAEAVDLDRGHSKSLLTRTMREAADEIDYWKQEAREWATATR